MEENNDTDFETRSNSVGNTSDTRLLNSNFRPISSNSNPLPGTSDSNSPEGPSSLGNNSLERDHKIPKKRSHSENDDWVKDNKFNKRATPAKDRNTENDANTRTSHIPLMSVQDIALASQQMAVAMSQQFQPQTMHQQAIPYPSYGYMNMGNTYAALYKMLNYNPFATMDTIVPIFNHTEPIILTNAVLTPPLPGETRSRLPKPPGCRTVFVGNLPEKITEEIIREAFQICGVISTIRMSKKNFCHIRFQSMESVDQALLLSGFRIKIEKSDDLAYNGRLHVDYAIARDDQHDYECLERARLREERHRQKEACRPPSPPPVPDFSEHEASTVAERLRNKETFREGLQILITWLDRGECNKKNSGTFYSLIQSSHRHVKRLRNKKCMYEEEVEKAKENLVHKMCAISNEIHEIEKVFVAAKTQKVWDHFTRSQRKQIEGMKQDTIDLKETNSNDLTNDRKEDPMDLSDDEASGSKLQSPDEDVNTLRERVNSLTVELGAALQTIDEYKASCAQHQEENVKLKAELEDSKKLEKAGNDNFDVSLSYNDSSTQYSPSRVDATESVYDSQLKSLITIFLHAHPFGASIDYIHSYLVQTIPTINSRDIEKLLRRSPHVFREFLIMNLTRRLHSTSFQYYERESS